MATPILDFVNTLEQNASDLARGTGISRAASNLAASDKVGRAAQIAALCMAYDIYRGSRGVDDLIHSIAIVTSIL